MICFVDYLVTTTYSYLSKSSVRTSRRQVIAEVFGNCVSYNIMGVDSAVSIPKQVAKAINLKEDSVRCYKTDHSN